MIRQLFEKLKRENLRLASLESLTGGLFAASITSVPGASDVFVGSAVTYSNEAKVNLGVQKETIDAHGAISSECAKEMVKAAIKTFNADVAISFTGNAGPTSVEGKPVGLVYVSFIIKDKSYNFKLNLDGDRSMIREQCVNFAIKTLYTKLFDLFPESNEEIKEDLADLEEEQKEDLSEVLKNLEEEERVSNSIEEETNSFDETVTEEIIKDDGTVIDL